MNVKKDDGRDCGSSDCYPSVVCVTHRRSRCPYCDLEAGFFLAIGSRDTLRDWVDVMRPKMHTDDSTLDQLVDNLDRLAEIIQAIKQVEEAKI